MTDAPSPQMSAVAAESIDRSSLLVEGFRSIDFFSGLQPDDLAKVVQLVDDVVTFTKVTFYAPRVAQQHAGGWCLKAKLMSP
jgi:hypothetical protein